MNYADELARRITIAAEEAGIEWSWCAGDGQILFQVFTEDENGTEARVL